MYAERYLRPVLLVNKQDDKMNKKDFEKLTIIQIIMAIFKI